MGRIYVIRSFVGGLSGMSLGLRDYDLVLKLNNNLSKFTIGSLSEQPIGTSALVG